MFDKVWVCFDQGGRERERVKGGRGEREREGDGVRETEKMRLKGETIWS